MIVVKKENFPVTSAFDPKNLFFDIETTGLSHRTSYVYLISLFYRGEGAADACMEQYFIDDAKEEGALLEAFSGICGHYTCLVHYNGDGFDIPFLKSRYRACRMHAPFDALVSVDLYRRISRLAGFLRLPRKRLVDVCTYLGITRRDPYTGKDLIRLYADYQVHKTDSLRGAILGHGCEDVCYLPEVLRLADYDRLQTEPCTAVSLTCEDGTLQIGFAPPMPVLSLLTFETDGYRLTLSPYGSQLLITGRHATLFYFFADYRNYYYLPDEDTAIHKSVAVYVDGAHRQKASAATAYEKREDTFYPQPSPVFAPAFHEHYRDSVSYFRFSDAKKQPEAKWQEYLSAFFSSVLG